MPEREMKKIALGRKNWLFFGSDQGGRTAAVLLSLVSSCQRHSLDPFRYLEDVLYRLPSQAQPPLDELLPDRWQSPHLVDDAASKAPVRQLSPPDPGTSGPGP